jgi:hypothetical protein
MSSNFRPEPQDGFSSYDRELHQYQEGAVGSFEEQFDNDYYGDDGETPEFDDEYDGQPSEYDEWQDFMGGDDSDYGGYHSEGCDDY